MSDLQTTNREEESEQEYPVQVYVYDLSHGLASVYSPMILGRSIPAIYHTSVVIRNTEYYLDQGIKSHSPPGFTKYGTPIEILDVGTTYIDDQILQDFISELNDHEDMKYHAISYDLFQNNCNHFTDVLIEFLVGKNLDDRILKLPELVLSTGNGRLLQQLISGAGVNSNPWQYNNSYQ
ncbi:Desumoylating isopeptidase 1 [Spathaspora sp. JA1]|nr:Desumoylating isopeptidase 1 [Spathaspora sp. JA1]